MTVIISNTMNMRSNMFGAITYVFSLQFPFILVPNFSESATTRIPHPKGNPQLTGVIVPFGQKGQHIR